MQVKEHIFIKVAARNDRSVLERNFFRQPFKVADISEDKCDPALHLMIMSSSPGILDKDHYRVKIELGEHTSVKMATQGYQRLFTMCDHASQSVTVHLKNCSSFYYVPHPTVPHKNSNFSSQNQIYLSKGHHLVWSEIITCGRKLCGEEFAFTRFHNHTDIFLENKLVVRENVLLEPGLTDVQQMGQMEGYSHQSTLLFLDTKFNMKVIANAIRELLDIAGDITFGISSLPANGLIIRILGNSGEKLFNYNQEIASLISASCPNTNSSKLTASPEGKILNLINQII
jgi:urease accessory protein